MNRFDEGAGLWLPKRDREALWARVGAEIEAYLAALPGARVAPAATRAELRAALSAYDFERPLDPARVVADTARLLRENLLHTAHPGYYGVFNPAASTMGVLADALVAAFNPQLASSASAAIAIEMERHLLDWFARRFGYDVSIGTFTNGGTAANHTALLAALTRKVPGFATDGVGGSRPVVYTSGETHHSILRAARMCGLGTGAVVELPVDAELKLDARALAARVAADRAAGRLPLFVVATLGTTSAGTFDDCAAIADVAAREGLWLHADAAWGGAAILLDEHRALFAGVERADSIALDAHKWLSVPMGAGLFLSRHPRILEETFRVDRSPYMPGHTYDARDVEPYKESLEWSRRFVGLKLWMTLATHGVDGYRAVLRRQVALGHRLRGALAQKNWRIENRTPLPVVCFTDPAHPDLDTAAFTARVAATGRAWITPTELATGQKVLRAGIASFTTTDDDVDALVETLTELRRQIP